MANAGWEFWKLTRVDDERVEWLAVTRPGARAVIDQHKVWTLVPGRGVFIANWFVTQDHHREDGNTWIHENIDVREDLGAVCESIPTREAPWTTAATQGFSSASTARTAGGRPQN
ncbi:hypothetical protein [Williamsia sp. D3]|uniref:hypothetical protein n=1 Tax=Williamsia sp. D3 TaxID=1313067 RepID=UPI001267B9DF|nr:hypothetical protein [Williamsia sp. D3]